MSNVTVQEALKAAQKVICEGIYSDDGMDGDDGQKALLAIDAALSEIEKCEPVYQVAINGLWLDTTLAEYIKHNGIKRELYTSPQPRECEPVAEAIRERDRLGFAVVNVIGKLDEIIENTQEVEIDDFLHIAVPIDMWNELQDALEDMPKRADLYTSPISKESTDWQYFDEAYKKATESSEPDDWMNAALMAQQVRRKQLNAPEKG